MVWTDRNSGLRTLRNILQVDRGMSYEVRPATGAAFNTPGHHALLRCRFRPLVFLSA